MRLVLEQEDTDGNFQIAVTDSGPKVLALGTVTSNGYRSFDVSFTCSVAYVNSFHLTDISDMFVYLQRNSPLVCTILCPAGRLTILRRSLFPFAFLLCIRSNDMRKPIRIYA